MKFKPDASATAIGSFPFKRASEACNLIFNTISEIPVWPQLPKISIYEDMLNQYSRSLPCYYVDEENNKSGFNTESDLAGELEKFYINFMEENVDYFGFEEKYSSGFSLFIDRLRDNSDDSFRALKGHITGPLTMGLATDTVDGKYAIYKPDLYDAIVKNCSMNARWQIEQMKEHHPNVIIFIDEPSLSILGSGYYSVDHQQVYTSFNEVIREIKKDGAIAGMHCCGNANWDEILKLDLDILNFDASDKLVLDKLLNSKHFNDFIEMKKTIAWGVVPTIKDKIESVSSEDIEKDFSSILAEVKKKGINESDMLSQSLITPSCGTGPLNEELAKKALKLTKKISDNLKKG